MDLSRNRAEPSRYSKELSRNGVGSTKYSICPTIIGGGSTINGVGSIKCSVGPTIICIGSTINGDVGST